MHGNSNRIQSVLQLTYIPIDGQTGDITENQVDADSFEEHLIIALLLLSDRCKTAFEYSRFENLTSKEIALKDTTNISELNSFFTSSEKVCETVLWIIRSLKFNGKGFGFHESDRSIYGSGEVLTFLLLFPLFQLSNVRAFSQSVLAKLFGGAARMCSTG